MGACPKTEPTKLAQELAYRPVYSHSCIQELARSLSDLARPADMPALLASDGNVLVDILDLAQPSVKETKDLLQWSTMQQQDTRPMGVPRLETVDAFAATPQGYKVHDPHVKYVMALVNSLPKGTELPLHTTYSRQAEELGRLVRHLRQKFLPLCEFHYCSILRGTLGTQFPALTVDDPAYVVMWKKNDHAKQLFIVSVASLRVNDQFDVTKWSYVLFWSEFKHSKDKDSTDMDLDDPTTTNTTPDPRPPSRPSQPVPMDVASPQDPVLPQASPDYPIPEPEPVAPEPPTIHMDPVVPHSPPLVPEVPAKRMKTQQEKTETKSDSTAPGPSTSSSSNQPMPTSGPILPVDPTLPVNIPILPVDGDSDLDSEASTLPYDTEAADLVIDEHPTVWAVLEDTQKMCSNTASFSVPQLLDEIIVVMEVMQTPHSSLVLTHTHLPPHRPPSRPSPESIEQGKKPVLVILGTMLNNSARPKRRNMRAGSKMTYST